MGLTLGGLVIMVATVVAGGLSWPALLAIPAATCVLGALAGAFLTATGGPRRHPLWRS